MVGVVGLLVLAALAVTVGVGTGAAASRASSACAGVGGPPAVTGTANHPLSADDAGALPADDGTVAVGAEEPFSAAAGVASTGGGGPAAAARAANGPVQIIGPQPGAVIVASTAGGARRLHLTASLLIARPTRGLGLRLNGHDIDLPARSGRLRVVLDAADGLIVGDNLLWVTVHGSDGNPSVPFVVGYRDGRVLGAGLRLGAGRFPAAVASLRLPLTHIDRLAVTLNGVLLRTPPDGGDSGRLALYLSQLGPVHWGSNRVAVRLIMMDGGIADWTRTFRLDPGRNVAVARLDGPAMVGRTVTLDASRSLIVPGQRQHRRVCWVLLRRPRLSRVRLGRSHGAGITLRPDVPGYYQVALLVGPVSRPPGHEATVADSGSG
ncbi:MAG: hypothetical protein JO304_03940, partial [Solirubrobacterales bacterium]|nr:hypothetical protein [Solirubrobacterales bacterium]